MILTRFASYRSHLGHRHLASRYRAEIARASVNSARPTDFHRPWFEGAHGATRAPEHASYNGAAEAGEAGVRRVDPRPRARCVVSHYSRVHFSDSVLLRRAASASGSRPFPHRRAARRPRGDRCPEAVLAGGVPSMLVFCVRDLHYSEDEAFKRIRVARVAREFPAIFESVADGRLSLTAVVQIAPHLTAGTAGDVIAAAAHRSKTEIQRLIAERFPARMFRRIWSVSPHQHIDRPTGSGTSCPSVVATSYVAASRTGSSHLHASDMRCSSRSTMRRWHCWKRPSGCSLTNFAQDISGVIKRAPAGAGSVLEKRKFAATNNPDLATGARVLRATSQSTSRTPCGCATVASAPSSASLASVVRRGRCSNSITSWEWPEGVGPPWQGCGCSAWPIISTRRSARSEPSSWSASVRRRAVSRRAARRNGRQPLAARIR